MAPHTTLVPLPADLERWDRGTKFWGRVGAVAIVASILLPNLWLDRESGLHVHGFWEDPERDFDYVTGPALPRDGLWGQACWLLLAGVCWWVSVRGSLFRRGVLWTSATVLIDRVVAPSHWMSGAEGDIPWPLVWPQFALVCAALGLLLVRTRAHPAAGAGICLFGGLYALLGRAVAMQGSLEHAYEWYVEPFGRQLEDVARTAFPWLRVVLGVLLVCVGLARGRAPRTAAVACWLLAVTLLVGLVSDYLDWGMNVRRGTEVAFEARLSSFYVHLRLWLRPHGAFVLLVAGLFAWIVAGTRTPGSAPPRAATSASVP